MADLLLVEDDPDVNEVVAEVLRSKGNAVRTAKNGEEGLMALGEAAPDVVLLDVEMPVLDGPGMASRMLEEDRGLETIPIVLLSGVIDLPRVAAEVGTPYFLTKPFSLRELERVLERALRERRAPGGSGGRTDNGS